MFHHQKRMLHFTTDSGESPVSFAYRITPWLLCQVRPKKLPTDEQNVYLGGLRNPYLQKLPALLHAGVRQKSCNLVIWLL